MFVSPIFPANFSYIYIDDKPYSSFTKKKKYHIIIHIHSHNWSSFLQKMKELAVSNTKKNSKNILGLDPLKDIKNMASFRGESNEPHFVLVPLAS